MTQGNSMKLIAGFFFPILIGNFFQQFYSFVDSVIVGKGIGDAALAAVGNTGSVHFMILGFAIGLSGGLGICISQSFGSQNYDKMRKQVAMSIYICFIVGLVETVLSLTFMKSIFHFMQTPEDMLQDTETYFRMILIGILITIFNNFFMTLLRSVGDSKTPLISMILSSAANIIMDVIFVFVWHWGVFGAAFATVLAQFLSMLFCLYKILQIKELKLKKTDFIFCRDTGISLILTGIPVAIMNSVTAVGGIILQYFVNGMGTGYVAAYAACMKLCGLFEQPSQAVGLAVLTYVGQNFGAGKIRRIKSGVKNGLILATVVTIPVAVLMIFFSKQVTSLMLTDMTVISYTKVFLRICGISMFGLGFLFIFRNACQGMGKTVVPMLSGILEVSMRVITALLLVKHLHFTGVAIAEVSAWIGAWIMLFVAYLVYIKKYSDTLRSS